MLYDWIKALHIIFVIALMASLMIYPRYKIHQLSGQPGEPLFETMKAAAQKLRMIIMNPSLILVWVFGLLMVYLDWQRGGSLHLAGWFHTKLLLVLILSGIHGWFIGIGKKIDKGVDTVTAKRLRMLNEVPFLLMVGIVLLVILRPF